MALNRFSTVTISAGFALLGVAGALYFALMREATAQQALSPGEDSLGVAALFVIYGPPVVAVAAAGLLSIVLGISVAAVKYFRRADK